MFVVVLLTGFKIYIPIVEEWIYDIDEESLKNNGVNSNRNVRIFWSKIGMNNDGIPNAEYKPKFNLPVSRVFPPHNDEACYIGRIKFYFGKQKKCLVYMNYFKIL